MASGLFLPVGTNFAVKRDYIFPFDRNHASIDEEVQITFVEEVGNIVLRMVYKGTEEEVFIEASAGTLVRPSIPWLLDGFADGMLRELSTGEATLTEWQGRYLGLDRGAIFAKDPFAVKKYDIAVQALIQGLPRSAVPLHEHAKRFVSDDEKAPSGRSVIRWMDTVAMHDGRIGALCNRSGRAKGYSPLPPILDRLVQKGMALYWGNPSISKMDAHSLVAATWNDLKKAGEKGLGTKPPSKTTVCNRINKFENKQTCALKNGAELADRHYRASGQSMPTSRCFELVFIDGTEFEQICLFADEVPVPSNKMKAMITMDAHSLFVFPHRVFAGPYRPEMGMGALLGALTKPVLSEATRKAAPLLQLAFGKIGRLRGDNDKALIPPSAIANLTSVVTAIELAARYNSDEKANLENYNGYLKRRLAGQDGTVLSARSRRRSIRRDSLQEASMTRAVFAREVERLRLEWNDMPHKALGNRSPNQIMCEHLVGGVRFMDTTEVERHLARTVPGVMTTDGVVYDGIQYLWNGRGVTKMLSGNQPGQLLRKRLEGTARCDVKLRVYDWNLDFIEVLDESTKKFIRLWSTDEDYTAFLTRYEHSFHKECQASGATGAITDAAAAIKRGQNLRSALNDVATKPYKIAKNAAAVLESSEVRKLSRNAAFQGDLTDFSDLLIPTAPAGLDRADAPLGPSQSRENATNHGDDVAPATSSPKPSYDWGGLDPAPKSVQQMLDQDQEEEDLDGGINWDDDEPAMPPLPKKGEGE